MDMGWRAEEDCELSMFSSLLGDWSSYVLVLPCLVMVRGEAGRSREGWLNFLVANGRSFLLFGISLGVLESIVLSLDLTDGGVASLRRGNLFPVGVAG